MPTIGVIAYGNKGSVFGDLGQLLFAYFEIQLQLFDECIDKVHSAVVTDLIVELIQLVDTEHGHQHFGSTSATPAPLKPGGLNEFVGFNQFQSSAFGRLLR